MTNDRETTVSIRDVVYPHKSNNSSESKTDRNLQVEFTSQNESNAVPYTHTYNDDANNNNHENSVDTTLRTKMVPHLNGRKANKVEETFVLRVTYSFLLGENAMCLHFGIARYELLLLHILPFLIC